MRSFLINLAMLGATLSVVAWLGWTVPPNRGEAGPVRPAVLSDEHDVVTPVIRAPSEAPPPSSSTATQAPRGAAPPSQPLPSPVRARLDINRATLHDLEQLPGIGPALAQRIIDHRRSHGPFVTVDDLMLVKGIGSKKLDRVRDVVTVVRDRTSKGK